MPTGLVTVSFDLINKKYEAEMKAALGDKLQGEIFEAVKDGRTYVVRVGKPYWRESEIDSFGNKNWQLRQHAAVLLASPLAAESGEHIVVAEAITDDNHAFWPPIHNGDLTHYLESERLRYGESPEEVIAAAKRT